LDSASQTQVSYFFASVVLLFLLVLLKAIAIVLKQCRELKKARFSPI
jgi:hypothetical protein